MKKNLLLKTIALTLIIALCLSTFITYSSNELKLSDEENKFDIPLESKSSEDKISLELSEEMERVLYSDSPNDKIMVYIWYNDIDQVLVEQKVETNMGLTRESINTDLQMPDEELLDLLSKAFNNDFENVAEEARFQEEMDTYIESTEKERALEIELADTYISTSRNISKEMYKTKGDAVVNELKITSKDLEFQSKYAPMLIAEMTCDEIISAAKNTQVDLIDIYTEMDEDLPPPILSLAKEYFGFNALFQKTGLTGKNVKVGIVDHGVIKHDDAHKDDDNELPRSRFTIIGKVPIYNVHADNSARILAGRSGIAPGAQVYSVGLEDSGYTENAFYQCIEALLDKDVSVISGSINIGYRNRDVYTIEEKWIDHIVRTKGLLMFKLRETLKMEILSF